MVVVSLVLCWVVGLVLVWTKRQWTTTTKAVITAVVGVVIVAGMVLSAVESRSDRVGDAVSGTTPGPVPSLPSTIDTVPPDGDFTRNDMQRYGMPVLFEAARTDIIELVEDDWLFTGVNDFSYDTGTGDVSIDVTPAYDFDAGVRDDAWVLMSAFAVLWDEDSWFDPDTGFAPGLDVTISTARYRCDGDTMLELNLERLSREQWERRCRVR